ncbi:hypothetical protein MMC25_002977 [Agyrium rufum]|nr:hypothetical protein [Agyrium rufum]
MPGLGKTQLALKYANIAYNRERFPYVFWISAASVEKLKKGFSKILDLLGLAYPAGLDRSKKCNTAQIWLEDSESITKRKWLLVLDNINEKSAETARKLTPRSNGNGCILMTTRTKHVAESMAIAFGEHHMCFGLDPVNDDNAVQLLLRAANIDLGQSEDAVEQETRELVKSIGSLPLAVDQAASFMKESGHSMNKILDIYKSGQADQVLGRENDLSRYQERSVIAAFAPALDQLERASPQTSDFLRILAFLDPESIPIDMLKEGFQALERSNDGALSSPLSSRLGRDETKPLSPTDNRLHVPESGIGDQAMDDLKLVRNLLDSQVDLQKVIQYLQRLSLLVQQKDGEIATL